MTAVSESLALAQVSRGNGNENQGGLDLERVWRARVLCQVHFHVAPRSAANLLPEPALSETNLSVPSIYL